MRVSLLRALPMALAGLGWLGFAPAATAQVPVYASPPPVVYPSPPPAVAYPTPPPAVAVPAPAVVVPVAPVPAAAAAEAAQIGACLCLRQSIDALYAQMSGRQSSYVSSRDEVGSLDAQLEQMRRTMNVNDPAAVSRYRQLLERRDAVFARSSGPGFTDYSSMVNAYNGRTNEYNARCANRPQNSVLVAQVQATLVCPAR